MSNGRWAAEREGWLDRHHGSLGPPSHAGEILLVPGDLELTATTTACEPARAAAQLGALAAARAHAIVLAPVERQLARPLGTRDDGPTRGRLRDNLEEIVGDGERPAIDVEHGFEGSEPRHAIPGSAAQGARYVHLQTTPLHSRHDQTYRHHGGARVTHDTRPAATCSPAPIASIPPPSAVIKCSSAGSPSCRNHSAQWRWRRKSEKCWGKPPAGHAWRRRREWPSPQSNPRSSKPSGDGGTAHSRGPSGCTANSVPRVWG